MTSQLISYLNEKGVYATQDNLVDTIIQQLEQKERTVSNLSEQITKYKCEDVKQKKLIKSLQDKITQLSPSISNTGSTFMMASEFKSTFEQFMTSTLPLTFGNFIDRPCLFSKCVADIFGATYHNVEERLDQVVSSIRNILNIKAEEEQKKVIEHKIKLALINILQEHWEQVALFPGTSFRYFDSSQSESQVTSELKELLESEDYRDLQMQLHKIAVYMIFQEKPWEFVGLNRCQIKPYSKKDFTCLDGWVKEGQNCLQVLQGIKKDGHMHANLKNYVIPYQKSTQEGFSTLRFEAVSLAKIENLMTETQSQHIQSDSRCALNQTQNIPALRQKESVQEESLLIKNKSAEFIKEDKENNPHFINKKSKKKAKPSLQNSMNGIRSPKIKKKRDESSKGKKLNSEEQFDEQIIALKEQLFSKQNSGATAIIRTIQDDLFEDFSALPFKKKMLQDLPVSKNIPGRKKTKPAASSRKTSVGKIVHQQGTQLKEAKQKQHLHLNHSSKTKNKQKAYKDIIKEKLLLDQKFSDKAPLALAMYQKSKTDRRKDENRPLKIQGNASKLREKYIN